jgi:hypothetical protein
MTEWARPDIDAVDKAIKRWTEAFEADQAACQPIGDGRTSVSFYRKGHFVAMLALNARGVVSP